MTEFYNTIVSMKSDRLVEREVKMKLRKLLALTLASAMVFSFVGCNSNSASSEATSDAKTEEKAEAAETTDGESSGEIIDMTFFGAMPQAEINVALEQPSDVFSCIKDFDKIRTECKPPLTLFIPTMIYYRGDNCAR